jgi:monoamine oxidase
LKLECDAVVLTIPPTIWGELEIRPSLDSNLHPQMGKNTKLLLAVRPPVWKQLNLKPEIVSDGLISLTWVSSQPEGDGEASLTLFSGAEAAEKICELPPADRARSAIEAISPLMPGLADTVQRDRFVPWPLMPRTKGSYSFPAPGQVTAYGPTLVDGIVDQRAPLYFAGEHTSYAFIGYMEGALSSGVRVAQSILTRSHG